MSLFKLFRIVVLPSILFVILAGTWLTERRLAKWQQPIWVTLYPIVDTENASSTRFAQALELENFSAINHFLSRELLRHGVSMAEPLQFQLAPVSFERPPAVPERHSTVAIALWSLQMRWWPGAVKRWRVGRAGYPVGQMTAEEIGLFQHLIDN